jgi:serine/threonine-protein kinase HipA
MRFRVSAPWRFRLSKPEAVAIAREVGFVVATWRDVAVHHGLNPNQIDRMASAFEHGDLARAIA